MIALWERWEPISGLEGKYNIEGISNDSSRGLNIVLHLSQNRKRTVLITYNFYVEAYSHTTNPLRLVTLSEDLFHSYGQEFHANWTFFKIMNSEYLAWLDAESATLSSYSALMHFCILAENAIIDIAIRGEPEVKIIESTRQIDPEKT